MATCIFDIVNFEFNCDSYVMDNWEVLNPTTGLWEDIPGEDQDTLTWVDDERMVRPRVLCDDVGCCDDRPAWGEAVDCCALSLSIEYVVDSCDYTMGARHPVSGGPFWAPSVLANGITVQGEVECFVNEFCTETGGSELLTAPFTARVRSWIYQTRFMLCGSSLNSIKVHQINGAVETEHTIPINYVFDCTEPDTSVIAADILALIEAGIAAEIPGAVNGVDYWLEVDILGATGTAPVNVFIYFANKDQGGVGTWIGIDKNDAALEYELDTGTILTITATTFQEAGAAERFQSFEAETNFDDDHEYTTPCGDLLNGGWTFNSVPGLIDDATSNYNIINLVAAPSIVEQPGNNLSGTCSNNQLCATVTGCDLPDSLTTIEWRDGVGGPIVGTNLCLDDPLINNEYEFFAVCSDGCDITGTYTIPCVDCGALVYSYVAKGTAIGGDGITLSSIMTIALHGASQGTGTNNPVDVEIDWGVIGAGGVQTFAAQDLTITQAYNYDFDDGTVYPPGSVLDGTITVTLDFGGGFIEVHTFPMRAQILPDGTPSVFHYGETTATPIIASDAIQVFRDCDFEFDTAVVLNYDDVFVGLGNNPALLFHSFDGGVTWEPPTPVTPNYGVPTGPRSKILEKISAAGTYTRKVLFAWIDPAYGGTPDVNTEPFDTFEMEYEITCTE
jgi:hypothetical protein